MTHVNFAVTTLLNAIWEGTLLAVAMWLFLKLLSRLNPTTRFTVLWITLLAVLALLLEPFTPRVSIQGAQAALPFPATNNPTITMPTPVKAQEPKFNLQSPSLEPHSISVSKANPGLESERSTEFIDAQGAPSESRWSAITAVQRPLFRIHSGVGLPFFSNAGAPRNWLLEVAEIEGKRHAPARRVAVAIEKSYGDERYPPPNPIARFE